MEIDMIYTCLQFAAKIQMPNYEVAILFRNLPDYVADYIFTQYM